MKNSNFKKVLAFVLSLAMILSVCTAGFAVSAETSEVDLNYYLVNDTTEKTWRNGNQGLALAKYDGRTVYRISPTAAEIGQFGLSSRAELTAEQAASVNSLSYYIANETGVALPINYKYYAGDGSKVANFNGYAYLMDAATGELVPLLVTGGYLNIPAGFKGYVIYDLSVSNRYGNSNLTDANGDILTTVDAVKTNLFKSLSFFPKYTEDMIKKAWYVGDLAVSKKSVEELAKYISGAKVISYNFNTASVGRIQADEAVFYWGNKFSGADASGNRFPTLVEYGGLEGVGSKFTTEIDAAVAGTVYIRDSFRDAVGSGLPFALENAKGFKVDYKVVGKTTLNLLVKGEGNTIVGTYYYVSENGKVTTTQPDNFNGSVYCVFNESDNIKWQWGKATYTWHDWVLEQKSAWDMALYSGDKDAIGDSITFGGFGFIYDFAELDAIINPTNPVVLDGSETPKRGANSTVGTYNGSYDVEVGDKYAFTLKSDSTKINDWFYMNGNNCAKIAVTNPENVNALSFRAYLPDIGKDYSVQLLMSTWDMCYYRGEITAINYDGTVYTAAPVTTGANKITLPSGFDGLIIMEVKDAVITTNYNDTAGTKTYQGFAAYYAAATFAGIQARIGADKEKVNYLELDELRLVYQDIDSYINDFKTGKQIAEINKTVAEREAAKEEAIHKGTNIVSKVDGTANNTSTTGTNYKSAIEYVANDSEDGYAAKMTYSLASVYNESKGKDVDTNAQVYNSIDTSGLDLHNMVGFAYRVNVVTPNGKPFFVSYQINEQQNDLVSPTIYLVADNGEISTYNASKGFNTNFTGTVVVLLNKDIAVKATWGGSKGEYTWPEFVDFYATRTPGPINRFNFWVTYSGAVADYEGAYFEYDSISVIYDENPIVKEIEARYDTEKYFAPINDLTKTTFTEYNSFLNFTGRYSGWTHTAPFTPTIDSSVNNPGGVAYKFTRVEFEETTTREFKIKNRSTLTKDELKEKEAIAYWVKVPEGETLGISKVIGGEADVIQTSLMTYDVVKGETKLIAGGADLTLSGFEGYVIIPLQNALIGKPGTGYDTNADKVNDLVGPIAYSDFIDAKGISQLYFYMAHEAYKNIATAFWMGEFQFVDSLSKFFAEIGADAKLGDVNGDTVVDIRDTVRLKKYNADATVAIAYNNVDIDYNGFIDTAAELIASRKQVMGVKYKSPEWDSSLEVLPEVMVGFYHGGYGTWDYYASDVADEADVLNAYTSFDMYSLAQLKKSGGAGWMYIHESHGGEPVFATKDGGYDANSTTLNEAWKVALDATIQNYKDQGVWNQVAGFHTEEMLMDTTTYMTQAQFAVMTKYLRETYGKRVLAVLSVAEVTGSKDGKTPAANAATYANVTDIGFDKYHITTDEEKATFIEIFNAMKTNTGNRTDMKYWLLPTTYCGKTADGAPSRTDESIAAEVEWFASIFADTTLIPESQRGGLLFYTFQTFYDGGYDYPVSAGAYGNFGLDKLLSGDYNYTLTAQAIADFAAKYVK